VTVQVYENNLYCIKNNRENLYKQICSYDIENNSSECIQVESVDTRDGNKAISIKKEGNTYRFNSLYNPRAEAVKWLEQFSFDNLKMVISMFGLGNGIFAREVIKKIGTNDIIIVYEPSYLIFEHVMKNYDLGDILQNPQIIIIVKGQNDYEFENALNKNIDWSNINSQKVLYHPQYDIIFEESYHDFLEKLKSHVTLQIVNQNTAKSLGEVITRNTIHNMKYILSSNTITDYDKVFPAEATAIIVGAGPSLDKNIDELKRAKGKSVIFATDTSLKYLFAHNIIPDYVVTLDSQKSMVHFSDERWKTINLLCSIESNPILISSHKARKTFYNTGKYLENFYQSIGKKQIKYTSGGSVATACFSFCANIGFRKIVLIGQDLAYRGEETHAGGIIKNARNTGINTLFVEDIYGNMIKTRHDWHSYILWFNDAIQKCKEYGIEVIDATEGGAKLNGATIMTLAEAVDQYCNIKVGCEEIDQSMEAKLEKDSSYLFENYIAESIKDLSSIENKSAEACVICTKLVKAVQFNQLESDANQVLINKIAKINDFIQKKAVYCLIDEFILSVTAEQLGEINTLTEDKRLNQINTFKKSIIVYDAVRDAACKIKPLLENVFDN